VVSEKGTGDLLALLEENPSFRLRIAGSGMDEQMLRDSPVGTRIEFLGTVASEKMSDFYQSVDVVVVPSRTTPAWSEQFGRVIVEAQATGTPVVAYDSGEIPWVAAQSAAILICEGDVRAMGDAVVKLLSDAQYYDEVSRAGLESVKKFCSNEVLADQISLLITASLAVS
jgi:glycosyltransferase involved in cell wall biosynthesis